MTPVSLTLLVLKTRQVEQLRLFYQTLGVAGAHTPRENVLRPFVSCTTQ